MLASQKREAGASPKKEVENKAKVLKTAAKTDARYQNGPDNVQMWDCGGHGDCGFRSVAASVSARNKKSKSQEEILQRIEKLALSLRAKSVAFLKKDSSWHESWFKDPEATQETEAGSVPTDIHPFLEACARPNKWFDSWTCFGTCDVIETPILVFKGIDEQWVFLQRFDPYKVTNSLPLPIFWKHGHFTTLPSDVKMPEHWKTLKADDVGPAISFLGGGDAEPWRLALKNQDKRQT